MKIFWFLQSHSGKPSPTDELGASRLLLAVTFVSLTIFGTWAYFAKLDEVTRAPGTVISSSRTQVIQSQDGGILEALLVKEGDTVKAGQKLAIWQRARAEATYLETRAKAVGLSATAARLRAEVFGGKPKFPADVKNYPDYRDNQMALFKKRQGALDEEISALDSMKKLVEKELAMNVPLVAAGDVSLTEVLRLQRQVADMQSQITNKRNKYFQDAQAELNKTEEDYASAQQTLAQRKNLLDQTELVAPMHGIVKNVRITTQGGVIRAGEEVMQIVPLEDDLLVEAKIAPSDIAFIRLGLPATVKIDAYDYTIYGSLPGKIDFISADTLSENLAQNEKPYYRARVRTTGRQFSARPNARIDILPGMTATIEMQTGRKTVFQYLTKPIVKTLNESLGER